MKQFDREGEMVCVTVRNESPNKFNTLIRERRDNKVGETIYSLDDNFCDIVIKSQGTLKIDGKYTLTLGHELMHCLYGDYHD